MSKKLFFIVVICLVAIFSLGQSFRALASELLPHQFSPVQTDSLSISVAGSNGCPDIAHDTAYYRFELPVTAELLIELNDDLAAGETPVIAFTTKTSFATAGQAQADYRGYIEVGVSFDRPDGYGNEGLTEALWKRWEVGEVAAPASGLETLRVVQLTQDMVDQVMPGDNVVMEARIGGAANSVGCEPDDQAKVSWGVVDGKDTPAVFRPGEIF